MLINSKSERVALSVVVGLFTFVVISVIVCYAQFHDITLQLLMRSIPYRLIIKLLVTTAFAAIAAFFPSASLKEIKSNTTGDGQHGTARWASDTEVRDNYKIVKRGQELTAGFVVGLEGDKWIVDTSDKSMLLNAPPGVGKTTRVIVPNIYYNAAVNLNTGGKGASMLCTDMKGELINLCGQLLEDCGYSLAVLNLRYPFNSHCFNLINNTNRYMERYLKATSTEDRLVSYGAAERYAKMLAQSIVYSVDTTTKSESGQYFNETAQGLLTGIILLVSEYACKKEQKHIISVFNLIIELNGASESAAAPNVVQRNKLEELLKHIDNDRIRQHVGAAMSADIRSSMNIFSSALGKLVGLIDAELEQMIAKHSPEFDDVDFVARPTAIFIVCPDDIPTRYFFGSLFLRYFLNDLIGQARAQPEGHLTRQVFCYWDEFGNMPTIKDIDVLFSAVRSAGVRLLPVIQSLDQLRKSYSETTANIICSTCQITLTSQVSPLDRRTAEEISKSLGNRTVQSGSVSMGEKAHKTVQLTGRALMTPDEIINMQQGEFICMNLGVRPMKTHLEYYANYLRRYPSFMINVRNEATIIDNMTAADVKIITHAIRLHKGMFERPIGSERQDP